MDAFTYEPSDDDVLKLAKLKEHPGWTVFTQIMKASYSQVAVQAIEEMDTPQARPTGYYKGYMDSLRATTDRVDYLVEILRTKRQEENEAARSQPISSGSGSTV